MLEIAQHYVSNFHYEGGKRLFIFVFRKDGRDGISLCKNIALKGLIPNLFLY